MQLIPLQPVAARMRALGWYESHLFTHSYLRHPWCVGLWPDGWTLSRATATPGIYEIKVQGVTLAELENALRAAEIPMEATTS